MECVLSARLAVRWIMITGMLCSTAVHAQTVRSAVGTQQRQYIPPARQPHNSMARDTTPFNCEQYRNHPHPGMAGYCQGIENMTLQGEARRHGRPAPSTSIIELPPLGSEPAKALGYACVGGQAFKRLSNGWEQVSAAAGRWQREEGNFVYERRLIWMIEILASDSSAMSGKEHPPA